MVPGRRYTVRSVARLLWRRRWLVAIPLVVLTGSAVMYSKRQPNLYRAETTILLTPQRVPEAYVRSTVTTRIEERLRTISQQILSRTRLESLIREFKLYPELVPTLPMEQIVALMRAQVAIELVRESSFRIAFTYGDAATAAKVAQQLSTLFIEENLRDRELQADSTSRFLEAELNDARKRLIDQEKRLEGYRKAHSGSLPSQLGSNLQMIQTTQQSLTLLAESSNRLRDRRAVVERQIAEQQTTMTTSAAAPAVVTAPPLQGLTPTVGPLDQQIAAAQQNLKTLALRLKPEHPDVQRARRQLLSLESRARAEAEAEAQAAESPATSTAPPTPVVQTAAGMAAAGRLRELERERAAIDAQLAQNEGQEKQHYQTLTTYQARLEELPTRESELTELTRDYATLQASYQDLLSKRESSVVAANLERRQIGEQFRVIDPARVPELPVSPNRMVINGIGAMLGLLLGLGTAVLLEIFNTTLRTNEEVGASLGIAPLGMIPALYTPDEERRATRLGRLEAAAVSTVVVAATVTWWLVAGPRG